MDIKDEDIANCQIIVNHLINKPGFAMQSFTLQGNVFNKITDEYAEKLYAILIAHFEDYLYYGVNGNATYLQGKDKLRTLHNDGVLKWYIEYKKEKQKSKRADDISEYDFLIKKWTYKSRYLPYFISAAAFVVSVLAYCHTINKDSNTERKTEQPTIQALPTNDSGNKVDSPLKKDPNKRHV